MNPNVIYYGRWILLGAGISLVAFLLLQGTSFALVSFVLFFIPVMYAFYLKNSQIKGLEENFRIFLDDLKDLLQGGVNVSDALVITARNDYGPLSIYIKKLAAKVRLGIPFEKAMTATFAKTNSLLIKKIILVINQTLRAGGNFMKVFTVAIDYVEKIERLKNQRKSRTTSTMINSYLMFYVFVMIIIAIQVFFVPMLTEQMSVDVSMVLTGGIGSAGQPISEDAEAKAQNIDYTWHFTNLIIVQAIFAGPMIGKISEDSFIAGLKHSIILLSTSLVVYLTVVSLLMPK
jgi:flagellar protein FlaJ